METNSLTEVVAEPSLSYNNCFIVIIINEPLSETVDGLVAWTFNSQLGLPFLVSFEALVAA